MNFTGTMQGHVSTRSPEVLSCALLQDAASILTCCLRHLLPHGFGLLLPQQIKQLLQRPNGLLGWVTEGAAGPLSACTAAARTAAAASSAALLLVLLRSPQCSVCEVALHGANTCNACSSAQQCCIADPN